MIEGRILSEAELAQLLIEAHVTDTEIMEYADGVLPPRRRQAVRRILAEHPDLMQLLESFLFTRGPVVEAFDEVFLEAPPEQLLGRPERAEPAATATPQRSLFGIARHNLLPFRFRFRAPVVGVFAALAAVVVTAWLMNQMVRDFIPPDLQGVPVPPLLQQALEVTPMGVTARLTEHVSVKPELTFFSRLQTWCREYGLVYGGNVIREGQIACRGKDGVWRVLAWTDPLRLRDKTELVGEDALGALAVARDDLKVGGMLGPEEEAPLIKDRWQRRP